MDHECRHIHGAPDDSGQLDRVLVKFNLQRAAHCRPFSFMKHLFFTLPLVAVLVIAQGKRTFTGIITDSMCADGDHSRMKMGANDAECTRACIDAHGAEYVLYDGKEAYTLSDQKTPEKFAAQKVTVVGTLDPKTKTIKVESIKAAQ